MAGETEFFSRDRITQQTGLGERLAGMLDSRLSRNQHSRKRQDYYIYGVTIHYKPNPKGERRKKS